MLTLTLRIYTNYFLYILRVPDINVNEKTLTIVFHAILSKNFTVHEGEKIVIRGENPIFAGGWERSIVPVTIEE
jgi:hypothetical protein